MTRNRHSSTRTLAAVLALTGLLLAPVPVQSDDTTLFTTSVPPNVLIVMDTSGSMSHIVWHPAYDPNVPSATSGCEFWDDDRTYYVWKDYDWDGDADDTTIPTGTTEYNGTCGNSGREIFNDPEIDPDVYDTRYTGHYLNWYFSDEVEKAYDLNGDGIANDGTILSQIMATDNGTMSKCLGGGTFDRYRRARLTAAKQVLRDVICRVNQSGEVRFGLAQFRESRYECDDDGDNCVNDANGGYVRIPIEDYFDADGDPFEYTLDGTKQSHEEHIEDALKGMEANGWTPLAETLFQVYTYFMSRDSTYRGIGKNGDTFPEYEYDTDTSGAGGEYTSSGAPGSPVEEWCQKNFVILLTDGEPAKDDFTHHFTSHKEGQGFDDFVKLIGDYKNPGDENETPTTFGNCNECDPSLYLDDIAAFMSEKDHQPDETKFPGNQTIDVYTVGFTTGKDANDILKRTAQAGNGQFFTSNNAEALTEAIIDSLRDIIAKSQGFAAASIPASRSADGNSFYVSYFTPSPTGFWEGHLKSFEFNAAGEIRDAKGNCALADPNAPTSCNSGPLKLELDGFWDAADAMPDADENSADGRTLYVSKYATPPSSPAAPMQFTSTQMSGADLRLDSVVNSGTVNVVDELLDYSAAKLKTTGISSSEELGDAIVAYARGCEFGDPDDGCADRGNSKKLYDIFHSNPVVVGNPNAGHSGASYREFRKKYAERKRVLYAGSNGGFLHGFNAGEWRTTASAQVPNPPAYDRGDGEELFGFMPWPARQNIRHLPSDRSRDHYFVDGPPVAADVWMPPSATAQPGDATSWNEWRTVLIGGMRQGGETYYALDITNPSGMTGGPQYPLYMWEYPCEAASCDSERAYIGETWSEPVITRVKATLDCSGPTCATYDRWVAIVGGGYHQEGDPNDAVEYDATKTSSTSKKGRAILMIDVATGEVLAAKRFDPASATAEGDMRFAFPSSPAVFDVDFDGYADVVYIGDLGGNVWKWVISGPAYDHIRGATGDEDQTHWPFLRFFEAVACSSPDCSPDQTKPIYFPATGTLYRGDMILAFGTGDRQRLSQQGTAARNRYYVLKDVDIMEEGTPLPTTGARYDDDPLTVPADVVNRTTLQISGGCIPPPTTAIGYYVEGVDGEKFITTSQIFFGLLLTGSFVPSGSTSLCDSGGTAYLYGMDLTCGVGGIPDATNPDANPPKEKIPVGPGLPSSPRVSVGALDEQDPDEPDECENVVLMMTSDNEANIQTPVCAPSSGVRVRSWKNE